MSNCLVSVGGKLWWFALTVNLEEFLMELSDLKMLRPILFLSNDKRDASVVGTQRYSCCHERKDLMGDVQQSH